MKLEKSFLEIKTLIDQARNRALKSVNTELVQLYWDIGAYISKKMDEAQWGDKTIEQLAGFLKNYGPDYKGFNRRNLYRMKQFYQAYQGQEIVSPLVTQLGWSHHLMILSKTKNIEEREFYIKLSIQERYSKRELERQLDAAVYERTMMAGKRTPLIAQSSSGLPIFKDSYVLNSWDCPKTIRRINYKRS